MDAKWAEQEETETHEDKLTPNLDGLSALEEKLVSSIMKLNTYLAQE